MNGKTKLAALGVAGAAALALALPGTANAYPPGNKMFVTVHPKPVQNRSQFTATAANVKPGCTVSFTVRNTGKHMTAVADSSGVATATFFEEANAHRAILNARTVSCNGEKASTGFWVAGYNIYIEHPPQAGQAFQVHAINFKPGTMVTITVTKGSISRSVTVPVGPKGEGFHNFTLAAGTWVITAASDGNSVSQTVHVS